MAWSPDSRHLGALGCSNGQRPLRRLRFLSVGHACSPAGAFRRSAGYAAANLWSGVPGVAAIAHSAPSSPAPTALRPCMGRWTRRPVARRPNLGLGQRAGASGVRAAPTALRRRGCGCRRVRRGHRDRWRCSCWAGAPASADGAALSTGTAALQMPCRRAPLPVSGGHELCVLQFLQRGTVRLRVLHLPMQVRLPRRCHCLLLLQVFGVHLRTRALARPPRIARVHHGRRRPCFKGYAADATLKCEHVTNHACVCALQMYLFRARGYFLKRNHHPRHCRRGPPILPLLMSLRPVLKQIRS